MPQCLHVKPTGELCRALPMKGEGYCYVHHPDYEERRRRAGSRGGKRGGRGRPVTEAARITSRLERLADDVLGGAVEKGEAAVVGQLLNYCLRGISVTLKAKEAEELEGRLEELENLLEAREGQSRWR